MKIFLILIVILFSYLIAKELLDDRPFKCEKYISYEELNNALKKQFPVDSDMQEIIIILEKSGAKCAERSKSTFITNEYDKYDFIYWCKYESGWLTVHPLEFYTVRIMRDKNYKLMYTSGIRTKEIVI